MGEPSTIMPIFHSSVFKPLFFLKSLRYVIEEFQLVLLELGPLREDFKVKSNIPRINYIDKNLL